MTKVYAGIQRHINNDLINTTRRAIIAANSNLYNDQKSRYKNIDEFINLGIGYKFFTGKDINKVKADIYKSLYYLSNLASKKENLEILLESITDCTDALIKIDSVKNDSCFIFYYISLSNTPFSCLTIINNPTAYNVSHALNNLISLSAYTS